MKKFEKHWYKVLVLQCIQRCISINMVLCPHHTILYNTNLCTSMAVFAPSWLSCSLVHNKQQVLGLAELPSEPRKRHTCAAWGGQSNNDWQVWYSHVNRWDYVKHSLWWELRRWFMERTQEDVTAPGCKHTIDDDAAFRVLANNGPLAFC